MNDILKELYLSYFEGAHTPTEEYWEASRQKAACWDELGISEEARTNIQRKEAEVSAASNIEWFREGFRLGAALMLELL